MNNKTATECWNILRGELDSAIHSYVRMKKQGKQNVMSMFCNCNHVFVTMFLYIICNHMLVTGYVLLAFGEIACNQ